ncbi:Serine/threonine protein kinase [Chondrus crispus]|uniref:non-specific serine/threonine protein kinase n=1 Tax=Chondrus crispus TaxID=2769 RepID=R7Q7Y3_CHOCR|nr:Serine/threonine protein kinase [Chondrus crispus]CDF33575.1 Serine/threonine protein kinase [Chondrus crispus]|eukprot:XP_005713378.1 Serine/threonine protein kinase [Chondrus crispus]
MGSRVGPYIVTSTLGQGTFGKVKLAQHQETGIEYAIKILDKSDIKANELTVNVRREIAIMKALNHNNIVNLREVLSSKTKLYIVMDLVRGGELFEQIERRGELDEKLARKYFQQLIDGVDYCHRRGVCHRDLKPENLLVDENGTLKITDFGVSSMKGGVSGSDLLYTACGTPYYCAPEIINGAEEGYSGVKIDAWSCGIILFLLLTGTLPFQNEDMTKLYEQINRCKVEYPSWMPADAKNLIAQLLEKDPDKRYSLENVKGHSWFLVDYEGTDNDVNRRSTERSNNSSNSSRESRRAPRVNSRSGSRSRDRLDRNRRSAEMAHPAPPPAPAPAPEPAPVLRDVVAEFGDKDLEDLITAALPGKPQKRIDDVVTKLSELDIDCAEDIQFLAETLREPTNLTTWLEDKSQLPSVTCMRISRFFFN